MRVQSRYAARRDDGALHSLFAGVQPAQRGPRARRRQNLFGMRNMLIAAVCVTSLLFWLAVQYYVRPTQHWKARVFGEDPYDSFYGDARALSDEGEDGERGGFETRAGGGHYGRRWLPGRGRAVRVCGAPGASLGR